MVRSSDYDDDDDRDNRSSARSSSSKTLLIVLGIVGGVICVCVLACAGVVYIAYKGMQNVATSFSTMINDLQTSEVAADMFMRDVAAGRLAEAYANTTKDYQARQTLAQFSDFVNKNPALKKYQPSTLFNSNFSSTRVTFQGNISAPDGANIQFTVQLAKDGATWKIDTFTIP